MLSRVLPLSCSPSPFFLVFLNDHTMFEIWKGQRHHEYKNTCMPHTFPNRSLNQAWTTEHSGSLVCWSLSYSFLLFFPLGLPSKVPPPPASLYSCLHSLDIFLGSLYSVQPCLNISVASNFHQDLLKSFLIFKSFSYVCLSVCLSIVYLHVSADTQTWAQIHRGQRRMPNVLLYHTLDLELGWQPTTPSEWASLLSLFPMVLRLCV